MNTGDQPSPEEEEEEEEGSRGRAGLPRVGVGR